MCPNDSGVRVPNGGGDIDETSASAVKTAIPCRQQAVSEAVAALLLPSSPPCTAGMLSTPHPAVSVTSLFK